jgi:enoyl-CoA hydratase/carnithine racemase
MTASLITVEKKKNITIIQLSHKTTNAISLDLIKELAKAVETVKADDTIRAMVLTSSNEKFLSIGFDIPSLLPLNQDKFLSRF